MFLAVRKAVDTDVDDILAITQKSFSLYQEELHVSAPVKALTETRNDILNDVINNAVFVAERDSKLVGSIRCRLLSDELAYVYRFGVSPESINTGFGSMLLDAVINHCKKIGVKAITLHTNAKYYNLARYYYGKGFYVHSTTFNHGYVRALFVLELEPDVDLTPSFNL